MTLRFNDNSNFNVNDFINVNWDELNDVFSAFEEIMAKDAKNTNSKFTSTEQFKTSQPYDHYVEGTDCVFEFAVVGASNEDVKIDVNGDIVTVERKNQSEKETERKYAHKSIKRSDFKFDIRLSKKHDPEGIVAKLDKGILRITIPYKKEAIPLKKTIKVE